MEQGEDIRVFSPPGKKLSSDYSTRGPQSHPLVTPATKRPHHRTCSDWTRTDVPRLVGWSLVTRPLVRPTRSVPLHRPRTPRGGYVGLQSRPESVLHPTLDTPTPRSDPEGGSSGRGSSGGGRTQGGRGSKSRNRPRLLVDLSKLFSRVELGWGSKTHTPGVTVDGTIIFQGSTEITCWSIPW